MRKFFALVMLAFALTGAVSAIAMFESTPAFADGGSPRGNVR